MKKNYSSKAFSLLLKPIFLFFLVFANLTGQAQTTCTSNDPTLCTSAVVDPSVTFAAVAGTTLVTAGTTFTLSGVNNSTLSITSGVYQVTTAGCVIARFALATTGSINTSTVTVTTSTGQTLTCNITPPANPGVVCVRICDPILTTGTLVRFGLNFDGNLNNKTVTVSAFSTLNLATAVNITCPSSFICLNNTTGCTPCDPNFPILSGKIRVFFSTPIPIGTPTPVVNAAATVLGSVTTQLTQFKLCLNADAGTTVARTYADYCVYSNIANQILPTTNLVLTLQSFSLAPISCPVSLTTLVCPTGFTNITDSRTCVKCDTDPNSIFIYSAGKIRIFFPTAIPQGLANPVITDITSTDITAGTLKLCALADGGTNVARTYADYCVFSSIPNFTLPLLGPLTFTIQSSSCLPAQVCILQPVTLPPCTIANFVVIDNGNGGGTGGGLGTCASTSTCAGSTVYLASRLRLNLSTCLPANVPAPTISSIQTVNADGTISVLNNDYCINVSDESAGRIGTARCFIEYCVYAKVSGNTFFKNPPANLQFNQEFTATLSGQATLITTSCSLVQAVLPVTLLSFNYQVKNCEVELKWATAQETNSKEFIIQNSTDGSSWTTIGSVAAKGNSSTLSNYSFVHPNPASGKNYYRFFAVDIDGSKKFSDILTATVNCTKNGIDVHPNPFVNSVNIYLTASRNGLAKISIHDNAGRLIMQTNKAVLTGSNTINLNGLDRLLKGVYILTVQTDDAMINQKLLK